MIELIDDGTLDTVLRCTDCGQEYRGNYSEACGFTCTHGRAVEYCSECLENDYAEWVGNFIAEIGEAHFCGESE
jgi:hypothetical protein